MRKLKADVKKNVNSGDSCIPLKYAFVSDIVMPVKTDKIRYAYPWEYTKNVKTYGRK